MAEEAEKCMKEASYLHGVSYFVLMFYSLLLYSYIAIKTYSEGQVKWQNTF